MLTFASRFITQSRKPVLASYKLTYSCNLHCEQCPFIQMHQPDPAFSEIQVSLEDLRSRGIQIVIFEGGEPLLWHDESHTIYDVIDYAKKRFPCVGVTTNGTLPLDVEPHVLWVSIDGFKDTHDQLRGKAVFDTVIENIKQSKHSRIFAHTTVNIKNYKEVPELVRFLNSKVKGVTIQFYYPYGNEDALFLPFDKRAQVLDELIVLKKAGYPILNSISALQALKENTWRCSNWLTASMNPDGSVKQGCYLSGRAEIDCKKCGFSPITEISLAFQGNLPAIQAGLRIFF
jgi:Fe-coproporphyrin III synthase